MNSRISVQTADFDLSALYQRLLTDTPQIGAIVTFTGLVRDLNLGDAVAGLYLEHYPGMTEKSLLSIANEAHARWSLMRVELIHRVGQLAPADQIVYVGVSAGHRGDAFAACEFIMDYLKTRAPFWKRESTPGGDRWVDARDADQQAADRWK